MKTIRLFAVLDHLRARHHPVPAELLAESLRVSVRTIYRDMATLQAMGAPIRGESGMGYVLDKGHFLPPLAFDADELEAIMLGMRLAAARGDPALANAAQRVSAKVGAVLDAGQADRYQRLPLLAYAHPTDASEKAKAHLAFLRQAIRKRLQLDLHYVDLQEKESRRVARPLGLTVFDAVWLLTVWCETRADFRNLRVDRIVSMTGTGQQFAHERGKQFADYLRTLQ